MPHIDRRSLGPVVMAAVVVAGAVLASRARPFTVFADTLVAVSFVAVLGVGLLPHPPPEQSEPVRAVSRVWPWVTLLCVTLGWELFALWSSPRRQHPTLSYLTDLVTVHPLARGLVFASWLWLGRFLVRQWVVHR